MLDARTPLLAVKDLQAWYGELHILHGVTFRRAAQARWSRCSGATAPARPRR